MACVETMGGFRLRDRDAIVTQNRMIFRVYGYTHPPRAYICDPEYAPATIFESKNPRAYRTNRREIYYKFFADEGLHFVQKKRPTYTVWHVPLRKNLVGVKETQIIEARKPDKAFQLLMLKPPKDDLLQALHALIDLIQQKSSLTRTNFGVFGSLLHDFYHPKFSDIDVIIYGRQSLERLTETLNTLYQEENSPLLNEFANLKSVRRKCWKFQNYSLKEYVLHQKRKQIYATFDHKESNRTIKIEFEPVRRWEEIENEYNPHAQITAKGWIKMLARITDDSDAPFMPSVYQIEPIKILRGKRVNDIHKIVSFVEEFRMQAKKDQAVIIEGNLEKVSTPEQTFHQVSLTYGPRYYEQTLKIKN